VFAETNAQLPEAAHGLWSYMQQSFGRDVGGWRARDPLTRVRYVLATQPARMPALFMDVGHDDPFADQNRAFDAELTALGVRHVYREWPGTHNWDYWRAHVAQSLVWMAGKTGYRPGPVTLPWEPGIAPPHRSARGNGQSGIGNGGNGEW